jgi:anti-anti-sigma regulatory factor
VIGHRFRCILDLTAVTFLGSAGLTALVEATRHSAAPLRIVVDSNRPVIRPIEVTGLDDVLRLYHSVDEAVKTGMPGRTMVFRAAAVDGLDTACLGPRR